MASGVLTVCAEQEESHQKELIEHQERDADLQPILTYLKSGTLPEDENLAKKIVLESAQYDVISGVLHHENPNLYLDVGELLYLKT